MSIPNVPDPALEGAPHKIDNDISNSRSSSVSSLARREEKSVDKYNGEMDFKSSSENEENTVEMPEENSAVAETTQNESFQSSENLVAPDMNQEMSNEQEQEIHNTQQLQNQANKLKDLVGQFRAFYQDTTSLVNKEFDILCNIPLKEYSGRMENLSSVVNLIVTACQLCQSLSDITSPQMICLKTSVMDLQGFITKKIKEEDLGSWLDLPPSAEEDAMRLIEERRAADKARLARSAEARADVAKAVILLAEIDKSSAEATADFHEAIEDAKRAAAEAELALSKAKEAQLAAEEKRKVEEESKRLSEERARKKAEQEMVKQKEEERRLAAIASEKGTSLADERLAFEERKAREEEEKKNPRNWPRYIYSVEPGEFDPGIGCIIRAFPGTLNRDDLTVARVDSLAQMAVLEENEELISNVLSVKQTNSDKGINLSEPLSISIPHCAPRGNASREPVVKVMDARGKWAEVTTKDISFEDIKEFKFVEARVNHFGTFMVVLRPKRDHMFFGKKGGKVISTTEARVTLSARPGMFRVNTNFTLEVHPTEHSLIPDLKLRHPVECADLQSCSPVVRICSASRKFSKPLSLTVPLPLTSSRPKQRPSTAITRDRVDKADQRPSTAKPALISATLRTEEDNVPEDHICLLVKRTRESPWTVENKVPLVHQKNKDIICINMKEPYERIIVISTKTKILNQQAEKMCKLIEDSMRQKKVSLILRQNCHDTGDVVIACGLATKVDRLLQSLAEEDYDEGPPASRTLTVNEGQIMEVRFRGNVQRQNGEDNSLKFVYHSRISCRLDIAVEEIDKFAQKSFDCYRGFAQVFTKGLVPVPVKADEEKSRGNQTPKSVTAWEEGDILLGELLISLPKPDPEPPKPLNVASVMLKSEGAVDEDILKRISEDLGDEWKRLAQLLNVKKTRIQAILRQNHNNDTQCSIHDMLLTWAKRLPRSVNKVELLASALMAVGRGDLADDIRGKDYDLRQQRAQSARDSHLKRIFVKVAQDVRVAKEWKSVAKQMGLTEQEVAEVESSANTGPDRCLFALKTWRSKMGEKATQTVLMKHLRICRFSQTARVVQTVP